MDPSSGSASVRRGIRVRGVVQGVGFRPAMVRLARRTGVGGFVRNDAEGVWIEIEGARPAIDAFASSVRLGAPPLASIVSVELSDMPSVGEQVFRVVESVSTERGAGALVPPDAATCDACLAELLDPNDRRHRYPFINCTDCGPRFTLVVDLPYDRAATTMARFTMCAACRAEHDDPANRRYHAEPNACPACGPQLELLGEGGVIARADRALSLAAEKLSAGAVVALKGLGGYQLAVNAADSEAVARLRARKRRPHKALAVMARDLEVAARAVAISPLARAGLTSPARPIVLLPRRDEARVAAEVAPGLNELGVMLPTTPLHHLLLRDGPPLLVVTSGNRAEEPIAIDERDLEERLGGIPDFVLAHDRPIHTRADDSVVRPVRGALQPVRRARGFVPECVSLGADGPCVLAVGPQWKNTVCVARGADACLSQHIGDLDGMEARAFFEETITKLCRLLRARPAVVAHDIHPDYVSTRWAMASGLPTLAVQHHHAHVASCMADNGWTKPVIGVAFDGTGCGPEGDLWGGEFLLADLAGFRRLGHLRALALPGGEAAIRAPWRLALSAWIDAGEDPEALAFDPAARSAVAGLVGRGFACPRATGAGRWFDAIAALLGVRDRVSYEGQAAVELEALAARGSDRRPYPFAVEDADPFVVDLRPVVRSVAADLRSGVPAADVALRFHATLAAMITSGCVRGREAFGTEAVALSGGCFQNRLLTEAACALLEERRFQVLVHRRVPPNDGGVSLGQAAIARRVWVHGGSREGGWDVPRDPR